jgi:RHS repeat-associated protein
MNWRGFTGHEHLDGSRLIHMNGRAFDYRSGRFLSVDPIVQAPGNSQSLNPQPGTLVSISTVGA